jgi:hypothetical protein
VDEVNAIIRYLIDVWTNHSIFFYSVLMVCATYFDSAVYCKIFSVMA